MSIRTKVTRFVPLGLLVASATYGCLDFTPITVAPTSEGGVEDTGSPPIITDFDGGACEPCVEGASCSTAFATCSATPKCTAMFQCGLTHGCYAPGANLVGCLTVCGQVAMLSGESDPAVKPFLDLYECATTKCSSSCGN